MFLFSFSSLRKAQVENGLYPSSYIVPSMARKDVVYPQCETEVSFSRKNFFISLKSFSAVSHSCAAHRSQSEARILLRMKIQVKVCDKPKLSYIAGEHGARVPYPALHCPSATRTTDLQIYLHQTVSDQSHKQHLVLNSALPSVTASRKQGLLLSCLAKALS